MENIIFCDIDGTIIDGARGLLNPSDKTKYAFEQLCKDNYVFIASGRNKALLPENIIALNPNGYILCNGAYAEADGKCIYSKSFSNESVNTLKEYVNKHNGFYILESIDNVYCDSFSNQVFINFMNTWGMKSDKYKEVKDLKTNEKISISMIGFNSENDCKDLQDSINEFANAFKHLQFMSFDINIKNIDKGVAVKEVIKHLNIPFENTYAFGDGINDLEMLQAVGHPVIMANADDKIKNLGFEETDDVLDDGIYNYLIANKLIKPL